LVVGQCVAQKGELWGPFQKNARDGIMTLVKCKIVHRATVGDQPRDNNTRGQEITEDLCCKCLNAGGRASKIKNRWRAKNKNLKSKMVTRHKGSLNVRPEGVKKKGEREKGY